MGINNFICCKRSENINGIIKHDDELSNKEEKEDYLKFAEKNNDAINNDIELNIDPELPLDFPYTQTLNNSSSKILSKNNYDDNQQELIFNENLQIEEEIIYSVNNIPNEQKIKLDKFYELCNKNGKPRSYNDFDPKGWTKFYPLKDTFFIINDTKELESIIHYSQIRTGIISDNVITTEGAIELITLLFAHYCDNVQISNNMFSIDANDIRIFDCECNGYIVTKNNIFGLNITAESAIAAKMFIPWSNHYIYPTNTDNNECFYFINNKIKCFGNTASFDVVSQVNKAICIKDNEINVGLANFNITTIPTSGKETIIEIGNNVCFSSIGVNISNHNSGDLHLIIDKVNIGRLAISNILKSEISDCVFKNQIENYYVAFNNSNENYFKNVRFEEYKMQLRVNAGNCNTYFDDLDSTNQFPRTYVPSGTLNISVNSVKRNIDYVNIGTTQQRPTQLILPIGFKFYDTTLKKPIYVGEISGTTITWVDATGTPV